ncbi:hypothetical protein TRFO_38392 [Tritrichomonas foetus]|uniref:Uncharacterized protein n=1 Tax=Tritrichomonas foetus TaxID=1144522 RepID=A0A1J4J8I0_9EUKA|nr:hypothetical protein TRFO_38392 [Tritrichomonas foetus]|eukprot:OHS95498.1 hypothetical protein TRFO_38392 [Tritrichomonas foetus]
MFILPIFLFVLSFCKQQYQTSLKPQAWNIIIQPEETVCINSSIPRTVFVFGASPDDLLYTFIEEGVDPVNSNISTNSIIFSIEAPSSVSFSSPIGGNVTFSTISLDMYGCLDGIYVSNEIESIYVPSELPIKLVNQRCFFLASYGSHAVNVSMNLSEFDSVDYFCDDKIFKVPSIEKVFDVDCDVENSPFFARVNTSAWEVERNFTMEYSVAGHEPFASAEQERFMTPRPVIPSGGSSLLSVILMVAAIVIVIAVIAIIIVVVYIKFCKKNKKIENSIDIAN